MPWRYLLCCRYKIQLYAGAAPGGAIPCFLRVHAQIYLELSDYKRLAEAVLTILSSSDTGDISNDDGVGSLPQRMRAFPGSALGVSAVEQ